MSALTIAERERSLSFGCRVTLLLLLNVGAYWLGHLILGGSSLLAETHEGESFLRPLHGDEFPVSNAVGWYSRLHGASVLLTLPSIAICAGMLVYEWVRLQSLRRRAAAGPLPVQ